MMNETARAQWEMAQNWIHTAHEAEDVNTTICYTGMAEFALKAAQFAVDHPDIVGEVEAVQYPPGYVAPDRPMPPGPTGGPQFWGAPQS